MILKKLNMGSPFGYATSILLIFTLFIASLGIAVRGGDDVKCIESEGHALLSFKHGLQDPTGILSSWKYETLEDCCIWRGVKCSNLTSHVIELDLHGSYGYYAYNKYLRGEIGPSLLKLSHLNYLDLSNNFFTGPIPNYIGSLINLKYLNLTENEFFGIIPPHLGNLSSLQTLDLGGLNGVRNSKSLEWLSRLSSLQYLDLSWINLENASDWMQIINKLPLLQTLLLSECHLPPPIHTSYASFINISTSLSTLDLSYNHRLTSSSIFPWLFNFNTTLIYLNLASNNLEGYIPNAFGNLTSLSYIVFDYNELEGVFPNSSWNFCSLHSLSLRENNFKGMFSDFLQIFPRCALNSLQYLSLPNNRFSGSFNQVSGKILLILPQLSNLVFLDFSNNTLSGSLPDFSTLRKLLYLDLSFNNISGKISVSFGESSNLLYLILCNNKFSGPLPNFSTFQNLIWLDLSSNQFSGPLPNFFTLQNLSALDLSSNEFSGKIPLSLGQLSNLRYLNISNNLLEGAIYEGHFSKLIRLSWLDFSKNSLSFQVDSNWIPPFQLSWLSLSSCKLGPEFPQWLRWVRLSYLDLSNTTISDKIPDWFWNFSSNYLARLDLSNNKFRGELPTLLVKSVLWNSVNLRSNEFEGQIPNFLLQARQLDVSNNKFSGLNNSCGINVVSPLYFMDASNNQLSGQLSNCWWKMSNLKFLSLANNHFSGGIPDSFGNLSGLVSLHLSNNNFSGKLPSSLKNLNDLKALDLEGNQFTGAIPTWIGYELKNLVRLSLRSNQFDGELPSSLCHLNHIFFLDVSINNITGAIPNCLHNFSALAMQNNKNQADIYMVYMGNVGLCGSPLPECLEEEMVPTKKEATNENEFVIQGFCISLAVGFIFGFWGICGTLMFHRSSRHAYFKFLNIVNDWLFVKIIIFKNKVKKLFKDRILN